MDSHESFIGWGVLILLLIALIGGALFFSNSTGTPLLNTVACAVGFSVMLFFGLTAAVVLKYGHYAPTVTRRKRKLYEAFSESAEEPEADSVYAIGDDGELEKVEHM